jgi:hypothetical protein
LALADAIAIDHPSPDFERTFGEVKFAVGPFTRSVHGALSPGWLRLHIDGKQVSEYPRLVAQEIVASPDRKYFVVLSNMGLSSHAIAVIDRQGSIILSRRHEASALHYCRMSVTNVREWVDLAAPGVRFGMATEAIADQSRTYLKSVTVRGCDGKDIVIDSSEAPQ